MMRCAVAGWVFEGCGSGLVHGALWNLCGQLCTRFEREPAVRPTTYVNLA